MARSAIVASLLAASVAAQAGFATEGFKYIGCVEAERTVFDVNIDFFTDFTAEQCVKACAGSSTYAALGSGCQCSAAEVAYTKVDDSKCSVQCIQDDDKSGYCGGPLSDDAGTREKQLYNLYKKDDGSGSSSSSPPTSPGGGSTTETGTDTSTSPTAPPPTSDDGTNTSEPGSTASETSAPTGAPPATSSDHHDTATHTGDHTEQPTGDTTSAGQATDGPSSTGSGGTTNPSPTGNLGVQSHPSGVVALLTLGALILAVGMS